MIGYGCSTWKGEYDLRLAVDDGGDESKDLEFNFEVVRTEPAIRVTLASASRFGRTGMFGTSAGIFEAIFHLRVRQSVLCVRVHEAPYVPNGRLAAPYVTLAIESIEVDADSRLLRVVLAASGRHAFEIATIFYVTTAQNVYEVDARAPPAVMEAPRAAPRRASRALPFRDRATARRRARTTEQNISLAIPMEYLVTNDEPAVSGHPEVEVGVTVLIREADAATPEPPEPTIDLRRR